MVLTATKLRQNLYRILDEILDSGIPVKINRKGKIAARLVLVDAIIALCTSAAACVLVSSPASPSSWCR